MIFHAWGNTGSVIGICELTQCFSTDLPVSVCLACSAQKQAAARTDPADVKILGRDIQGHRAYLARIASRSPQPYMNTWLLYLASEADHN